MLKNMAKKEKDFQFLSGLDFLRQVSSIVQRIGTDMFSFLQNEEESKYVKPEHAAR
jgi:hypothetical protein